jgi:hypothetical protein
MRMQIVHQLTVIKLVTSKRVNAVRNAKATSPLVARMSEGNISHVKRESVSDTLGIRTLNTHVSLAVRITTAVHTSALHTPKAVNNVHATIPTAEPAQ